MLENIVRHIEEGMPPFEAALKGSREIGFTIISITVSLVAVFIPVLLMGGVVGRIFNEFAVVVTIAIAASAFVSLTLTPMLCARICRRQHGRRAPALDATCSSAASTRAARLRSHAARPLPAAQALMLVVFLATRRGHRLAASRRLPKGLFPQEDIGQLSVSTEARQDISFAAMVGAAATGRGGDPQSRRMWRTSPRSSAARRQHRSTTGACSSS